MASSAQQERVQFRQHHKESTESIAAKRLALETIDVNTAKLNAVLDQDGNVFYNRHGRRLNETAAQAGAGAGTGTIWVRNDVPNVLMFTDDTSADVNLTTVGIDNTLTTGNDADAQAVLNVNSLTCNAGIEIGSAATSTTAATSIALGKAATSAAANQVVIGQGADADVAGAVSIGYSADATTNGAGSTDPNGICIGTQSTSSGDTIVIGSNVTGIPTNANSYAPVLIHNNANHSAVTEGTVHIGQVPISTNVGSASAVILGVHGAANAYVPENVVFIGHGVGTVGTSINYDSVSVGYNARSAPYAVAVGSDTTAGATGITGGIAIGANATSQTNRSIAIGSYATAALAGGTGQIVIGGSLTAAGQSAATAGDQSVLIGHNLTGTHAQAVLLGDGLSSVVTDEFAVPGFRMIRGTLQTTDATANQVLIAFPLTTAGSVIKVDATAAAYRTDNTNSFLALFRDYHFRNISGPAVTLSSNIETSMLSDPETTGYTANLNISGTSIQLRITGAAAHTVNWVGLMQVWCAPDA